MYFQEMWLRFSSILQIFTYMHEMQLFVQCTIPLHQSISSFTNALALTGEVANGLVKGDCGVEQNTALVKGMSIHRKLILTCSKRGKWVSN